MVQYIALVLENLIVKNVPSNRANPLQVTEEPSMWTELLYLQVRRLYSSIVTAQICEVELFISHPVLVFLIYQKHHLYLAMHGIHLAHPVVMMTVAELLSIHLYRQENSIISSNHADFFRVAAGTMVVEGISKHITVY